MTSSHRPPVAQPLPGLLALTAGLLATLAVLAAPAPAAAAQPCWKQLISDWYDGRIDNSYPVSCYREALKNLPEDVRAYSSAREDIERALLNATRQNHAAPNDVIPPSAAPNAPGARGGQGGGAATTTAVSDPDDEPTTTGGTAGTVETEVNDPDAEAADDDGVLGVFSPSNADSVPLPLLVLAGLALLLLGSAAVAFVARRLQARRVELGPGDDRLPLDP